MNIKAVILGVTWDEKTLTEGGVYMDTRGYQMYTCVGWGKGDNERGKTQGRTLNRVRGRMVGKCNLVRLTWYYKKKKRDIERERESIFKVITEKSVEI